MPAKQKPGKGKQHQSKKSKTIQRLGSTTAAAPQETIASSVREEAVAPVASATTAKAATARQNISLYPHFGSEMRRIGILAVIILVVLVILSRVLA